MDLDDLEQEVMRLRDSAHQTLGMGQVLAANQASMDKKLDAIHASINTKFNNLERDIADNEKELARHDRAISQLKGMGLALTAGMPFVLFALAHIVR